MLILVGRWREADPAQHEKERLKKLKDEGEANGEHAQAEKVGEELEKLMETSQEGQAK
jgi:tRNA A37 methylthiotransferase MiaB